MLVNHYAPQVTIVDDRVHRHTIRQGALAGRRDANAGDPIDAPHAWRRASETLLQGVNPRHVYAVRDLFYFGYGRGYEQEDNRLTALLAK